MIGADGTHLRTRQIIDPDAPKAPVPGHRGTATNGLARLVVRLLTPTFAEGSQGRDRIPRLDSRPTDRLGRAGRPRPYV